MKGIALSFMVIGVLSALVGMGWGIQMSATGDHTLSPAHAHLNLLGFVSMAIYALFYHLVPRAAEGGLAKAHFGLAVLGLVLLVPGIVMAITGAGEILAKLGSVLTILSMLVFLGVVLTRGRAA